MFHLRDKTYSYAGDNSSKLVELQMRNLSKPRSRSATIQGTYIQHDDSLHYNEEYLINAMKTTTALQRQINEITLLLTEQLGFSDHNKVIKKCFDAQQMVSLIASNITLEQQQNNKKDQFNQSANIENSQNANNKYSLRSPKSTPIVTVKRQRAQSVADRFNVNGPQKPDKPEKPANFQDSTTPNNTTTKTTTTTTNSLPTTPEDFDQLKPRSHFKPASDFGNMNKKKRTKTSVKGKIK